MFKSINVMFGINIRYNLHSAVSPHFFHTFPHTSTQV